ncbi:MAG: WG repeat-containing protein [Candidatus Sericytochromatia bacterium]
MKKILLIFILFIFIFSYQKSAYSNEVKIDKKNRLYGTDLYVSKISSKYGIIDRNGKIIIQPIYNYIEPIFTYKNFLYNNKSYNQEISLDFFTFKKETNNTNLKGLLDKKGKIILNELYEINENNKFENFILYKLNDKFGVINKKGEKILSTKYDEVGNIFPNKVNKKVISFKLENKYGLISENGERVLNAEYDEIGNLFKNENSDYFFTLKNGIYQIRSKVNFSIIKELNNISFFIKEDNENLVINKPIYKNYFFTKINNIWYAVNEKLELINKLDFYNNNYNKIYKIIEKNKNENLTTYKNIDRAILLKNNFNIDKISNFKGNYASFISKELLVLHNNKKEVILSDYYDFIERFYFEEDYNPYSGWVVYDDNEYDPDEILKNIDYEDCNREEIKNGRILIKKNNKYILLNTLGIDISSEIDDIQGYFAKIKRKWYKFDRNFLLKYVDYDEIKSIRNEVYLVKKKNKFGYIDNNNNVLTKIAFDELKTYNKYLLGAKINNKWGLVDKNSSFILQPKFDNIEKLKSGVFSVKLNNKYGIFDKKFKFILKPQFDSINYNKKINTDYYFFITKINDKKGILDKNYKVVLKNEFKEIEELESYTDDSIILLVKDKNNKYGVFNYIEQKFITRPIFDKIKLFNNSSFYIEKNKKWGLMDKTGKILFKPTCDVIETTNKTKNKRVTLIESQVIRERFLYDKNDIDCIINNKKQLFDKNWHILK